MKSVLEKSNGWLEDYLFFFWDDQRFVMMHLVCLNGRVQMISENVLYLKYLISYMYESMVLFHLYDLEVFWCTLMYLNVS